MAKNKPLNPLTATRIEEENKLRWEDENGYVEILNQEKGIYLFSYDQVCGTYFRVCHPEIIKDMEE